MNEIVVQIEGVGELRFPEGTSMDVIQAKVKELTAPKVPDIRQDPVGFAKETLLGQLETAGTFLTGGVVDPLSKIVDIAGTAFGDVESGNVAGESMREAMTYMPRTEGGKAVLGSIGNLMAPVGEFFGGVGQAVKGGVESLTGSEKAGEITKDVLSLAPDVAGLAALKLRGGVKLKENGMPTRELRDILQERGITYEALTPEAQNAIPDTLPATVTPSGQTKGMSGKVAAEDIQAGGRQGGLATLAVKGDKVVPDPIGQEAVRQGFDERIIQVAKSTTPETRADMLKMLQRMESFKAGKTDLRPSDIAGQAVVNRVEFIRDQAKNARTELNEIARNNLAGKPMDVTPVMQNLQSSLDDLGVTVLNANGRPVVSYKGSIIEKDPGSQRVINDLLDLMSGGQTGAPVDALRFHNLKRQIDAIVDYGKSGKEGIPASGEKLLKGIRRSLNESLRQVDPDYARVNDTLSTSIKVFEDIEDSVGTKIDIFGPSADRAVGQQLRRLFSNTQARVAMEDAIKQLDDVSRQFGGNFNNSAYDLSQFATNLDKRFGAVAETSLQGVMESAVNRGAQVATQGTTATVTQMAADFLKKKANEARGVSDYNAMRAMEELLKRNAQ
jgi:hypothetical protein